MEELDKSKSGNPMEGEWETVEAFEQKYSRLTSVPVAFD